MEYLSKEEIKQWRSSLERITLEEYARRLGKTIKGEKQTNDIVDMVLSNSNSKYISDIKTEAPKETVIEIAKKTFEIEENKLYIDITKEGRTRRLNFNKPLTEREQKVLDYAKALGIDDEQLKKDAYSDEIKKQLEKEINDSIEKGINSTPTYIINEKEYHGLFVYSDLEKIVKDLGAVKRK